MAYIEKAPLLPSTHQSNPGTPSEADVALLRQRAEDAKRDMNEANKAYMQAWRRSSTGRTRMRNLILWLVTISMLTALGLVIGSTLLSVGVAVTRSDTDRIYGKKVALEAHIMSKCPDARDCLRDLVLPAMMQVVDEVDFTLSFIGKPTNTDDGIECKHGPAECLGNIIELCAAKLYPDPKIYLGFTMCMTQRYKEIPSQSLVQGCALEHGISFSMLNDCASDEHLGTGIDLLRTSVEHSSNANVTKSCTVRVDKEIWCVRDDGEWQNCPDGHETRDLVRKIRSLREDTL